MKGFDRLVGRLGTLKNQLLIFVVLIVIATHASAATLAGDNVQWKAICGVVLHFIGVLFPIGFAAFYVYALLNLPSSQQELLFAQTAGNDLAKHPSPPRRRRPANRGASETAAPDGPVT